MLNVFNALDEPEVLGPRIAALATYINFDI
jgi:hypothetical protein